MFFTKKIFTICKIFMACGFTIFITLGLYGCSLFSDNSKNNEPTNDELSTPTTQQTVDLTELEKKIDELKDLIAVEKEIIMTREMFKKAMKFIEKDVKKEDELCNALGNIFGDSSYIDIYGEDIDFIIELLNHEFGLSSSDELIEYWVFELNFGADYQEGCFMVDDQPVDISTVDKLYDYLIASNSKN